MQYFTGYVESVLGYNKKSDELRVGFALFRSASPTHCPLFVPLW
jgi:hypothetical protein